MVAIPTALDQPGLRLSAAELLALRPAAAARTRHRPATRRPGALPARPPGSGIDLRELRAYVQGDDPRRIDPSATARTGIPHIRSFHEDRDDTTLLIADFRRSMLWGTGDALRSVRGARHLAGLGWQAVQRGGNVAALALTGGGIAAIAPGQGDRQMGSIAQMLAGEHDLALAARGDRDVPPPGLAAMASRASRMVPPGSRLYLATAPEGVTDADAPALTRLARRRHLTIALILDPVETAPPDRALAVTDGRDFRFGRLRPPDDTALLDRLRAFGATIDEVQP